MSTRDPAKPARSDRGLNGRQAGDEHGQDEKLGSVSHPLVSMPSLTRRRQRAQGWETMCKQLIAQAAPARTWLATDIAGSPAVPPRSHHVASGSY